MDVLSKKQRSYCMSQIRPKSTKAEVSLRKAIWSAGIKGYRLHPEKVPGRPDIYFAKRKVAIFVDGCFWHECPKCFIKPKTNKKFWNEKIRQNKTRDQETNKELKKSGIKVIRIWEHEIKNKSNTSKMIFRIQTAINP